MATSFISSLVLVFISPRLGFTKNLGKKQNISIPSSFQKQLYFFLTRFINYINETNKCDDDICISILKINQSLSPLLPQVVVRCALTLKQQIIITWPIWNIWSGVYIYMKQINRHGLCFLGQSVALECQGYTIHSFKSLPLCSNKIFLYVLDFCQRVYRIFLILMLFTTCSY